MLKKTLIVVAILLAGLAAMIHLQPDTFSVQRSAAMAAPPEAVFRQINDLAAWDRWSPWKELDPNAKSTLSTPSSGQGATIQWSGNDKIGEGTLTILDSKPNEKVDLEQAFVRPMEGKARMEFTLDSDAGGTKLTWKMAGANNFIAKAMCLVMDMDTVLGPEFEKGLANIKSLVEKAAATPGG